MRSLKNILALACALVLGCAEDNKQSHAMLVQKTQGEGASQPQAKPAGSASLLYRARATASGDEAKALSSGLLAKISLLRQDAASETSFTAFTACTGVRLGSEYMLMALASCTPAISRHQATQTVAVALQHQVPSAAGGVSADGEQDSLLLACTDACLSLSPKDQADDKATLLLLRLPAAELLSTNLKIATRDPSRAAASTEILTAHQLATGALLDEQVLRLDPAPAGTQCHSDQVDTTATLGAPIFAAAASAAPVFLGFANTAAGSCANGQRPLLAVTSPQESWLEQALHSAGPQAEDLEQQAAPAAVSGIIPSDAAGSDSEQTLDNDSQKALRLAVPITKLTAVTKTTLAKGMLQIATKNSNGTYTPTCYAAGFKANFAVMPARCLPSDLSAGIYFRSISSATYTQLLKENIKISAKFDVAVLRLAANQFTAGFTVSSSTCPTTKPTTAQALVIPSGTTSMTLSTSLTSLSLIKQVWSLSPVWAGSHYEASAPSATHVQLGAGSMAGGGYPWVTSSSVSTLRGITVGARKISSSSWSLLSILTCGDAAKEITALAI